MLYNYMDESDQEYYLLEKIEEIIRGFNYDEDIGLLGYHRDLVRAVFFDRTKLEDTETKEKYKREFNGHDYVYRIIYDNSALRELQKKIRYGYFNEGTYDDFDKAMSKILNEIQRDFNIIFESDSLFNSMNEFVRCFSCWYPYMYLYDLLDIKMAHLIHNYSDDEIKDKVKALDYKTEFLYSAYWKWIRHQKLICFGNKCEFCGSKKNLQVHHRKYNNHGLEHKWEVMYKDLMITCENCHGKIHGYNLTEPSF